MFNFFRNTDPKKKLKEVFGEYQLASFPGVVMEVLQKIRNPSGSGDDVAKALALDPKLSVEVLKMANSVVFAPRQTIENLNQAVSFIGLSQVESIVLSSSVTAAMPKVSIEGFNTTEFWKISALRGVLAQDFARVLCPAQASESFTAGFLQDMALPFLATVKGNEYVELFKASDGDGAKLCGLERKKFDWDHPEIATWICAEWSLPESLASSIGGSHSWNENADAPESASEYSCPPSVRLSSALFERSGVPDIDAFLETAVNDFKVAEDKAKEITEKAVDKAEQFAALFA